MGLKDKGRKVLWISETFCSLYFQIGINFFWKPSFQLFSFIFFHHYSTNFTIKLILVWKGFLLCELEKSANIQA